MPAENSQLRPDDITYLSRLLRESDRPRYFALLFTPQPLRSDLVSLYGFAAEIARIPTLVSDPILGQIRLQWWEDSLERTDAESADAAPALRAIKSLVERRALPLDDLKRLIDARHADLIAEPPKLLVDLEARFDRTESMLFRLGGELAGASGPDVEHAARHAGRAYGLCRRIASLAADRARGRSILPDDLLAMEGLRTADVFASVPKAELLSVITAMCDLARHHLRAARERPLPRPALPVFMPLAVVEPLLDQVRELGVRILHESAELSDLRSLLHCGMARLRSLAGQKP